MQWRIQDFPWGGGRAPVRRGSGPPMRALFGENYAKMKELGPIGGGVRPARPHRSANDM